MKTALFGFAYIGWISTLVGVIVVAIDFQPIFGNKASYNDVLMSALISISSSAVWLVFNEQEKNEKSK